jgi:hypothetical protein
MGLHTGDVVDDARDTSRKTPVCVLRLALSYSSDHVICCLGPSSKGLQGEGNEVDTWLKAQKSILVLFDFVVFHILSGCIAF